MRCAESDARPWDRHFADSHDRIGPRRIREVREDRRDRLALPVVVQVDELVYSVPAPRRSSDPSVASIHVFEAQRTSPGATSRSEWRGFLGSIVGDERKKSARGAPKFVPHRARLSISAHPTGPPSRSGSRRGKSGGLHPGPSGFGSVRPSLPRPGPYAVDPDQ